VKRLLEEEHAARGEITTYRLRVLTRALVILLVLGGCISKAKEAIQGPEPEGGGTLTCKQILEDCDAQCSDPLCLHRCSPQGLPDARAQHDTLLECGERASCTDEECMRTNCPNELSACVGPDEAQPSGPPGGTPSP
jgi:hypothetical protein